MVVEHVHVYPGGQAIVGRVTHTGRGVQDKNEGQAHATDDQRTIDDKSIIIVSAKGYVTAQASCKVQWVVATAGAGGPIYSAHMRCSSPSTPERKMELNRIIVPIDNDQLSTGVDFKDLKS